MKRELILKEVLRHGKYSWPLTLLTYPMQFESGELRKDNWELQDERGNTVVCQVSEAKESDGYITALKLHMLCDLKPGEEKHFYFVTGDNSNQAESRQRACSSDYDLEIEKGKGQFRILYGDRAILCRLPFSDISHVRIQEGALFQEEIFICRGEGGREYRLRVKRISNMPFLEIREEMKGIKAGDEFRMQLVFEEFSFTHRYSSARPVERIDAYLDSTGKMPVTIMPYENMVPWIQSKHIAFLGEAYSAGIFIRDNLEWNDGTYPIWGSNRNFGITFRCDGEKVIADFPLINGKRFSGVTVYKGSDVYYVKNLWKWYAYLNLDKVKDWVLEWKEDQGQYPRFFQKSHGKPVKARIDYCRTGEMLCGSKMTEIIDERSSSVNDEIETPDRGMDPVRNREFAAWTVIFDLTADEMTKEEFDRAKAMIAFMAYAAKDENYMPTETMLAGHPNFLGDTAAIPGFAAALFPNHPEREMFREYFNNAVTLNLKYHIRPDVAAYESLGGRETENLACYSFAMLRPFMHVCSLFRLCGYPIPLVCENGAKWLNWMTNCVSAPVDKTRRIPQQGAHAQKDGIPYILYMLAQLLEEKYPKEARNTYAVCEGNPLVSFERSNAGEDIWWSLFRRGEEKGELTLKSEKFTGYGCILREAVGTPEEISVHVQQLDRGPNYRWGSFENTGNGGIYYYAAGRRYSFNAYEDTGDRNLGAEKGNCGFAVLKGHTYHNIGFQDLTEPLREFPVIKQIKLMAGDEIRSFYKYRRVSLVEKDYAVMYDAVTHMRAQGRFLWTVNEQEEFPEIWQVTPGVEGIFDEAGEREFMIGIRSVRPLKPEQRSKSVVYDGEGNFLTVVSHRKDLQVRSAEYGAAVSLPDRTDYLFEDEATIYYKKDEMIFCGKSGIISIYKDNRVRGALLEGKRIGWKDLKICLSGKGAVFFEGAEGMDGQEQCWSGLAAADECCTLEIGEHKILLEKGKYQWRLGEKIDVIQLPERTYSGINGFIRDTRRHEWGFYGIDFNETGEILSYPEG